MYRISFYENGAFSTFIGGEVRTLGEALAQIGTLTASSDVEPLTDIAGCKWDRHGTPCALIVTDMFGMPITNAEEV